MTWVRIHPYIANWPGGGVPPTFEIASDDSGTAVIELAWDPQALLAPASYPDPLRYYSSGSSFAATVARAGGGTLSVNVSSQTITVTGGRGTWAIPADLWAGYPEESLKRSGNAATNFSGNIYYRVRLTPVSASTATVWPVDSVLTGTSASYAPHIGVLPVSATVASQVVPDDAAVAGMGGIPVILPTLWSDLLRSLWATSPPTDPDRSSLTDVFAHPTFKSVPVPMRSDILTLWLFAGRSRSRIATLLSREVVTGSNVTTPIVEKIAYKGGKNLVQNLLDLMSVTPHPDLGAVRHDQLVDDVIQEIVDPNGQVNQGGAGLCVPTSIQAFLLDVNPAEYARLQVGWLSATGSADLADGTTAVVPPGILQIARYSTSFTPPGGTPFTPNNTGFLYRTFSEMAFQGAIMKVGKGSSFPSSNGTEAQNRVVFQTVYNGGLDQPQTKTAVDALFGQSFRVSAQAWPPSPTIGAVMVAMATACINDFTAHPRQVLLAVFWNFSPGSPPPTGQSWATHCVVPVRTDGGRMFFKNPQYAGSAPPPGMAAGGGENNPPRRDEDPASSLESITYADLSQWIYWYVVCDTALI